MRRHIPQQRPENFFLNQDHPLARGLMFAGLGNIHGGSLYRDLSLNGSHCTLTNMNPESDWVWNDRLKRWVLDFDGTNDYLITKDPLSDIGFLGDITVCCWANITSGGNDRHFAGKHLVNGASANPFDFRTDNSATPILTLVRANSLYIIHSGPAATLGSFVHYGFTSVAQITTPPIFYKDGVASTGTWVTGTPTDVATGTSTPIRIGMRTDGGSPGEPKMLGQMCDTMIWSRILSSKEMQELAAPNNFMLSGMIQPERRKLYPGITLPRIIHSGQSALSNTVILSAKGTQNKYAETSLNNVYTLAPTLSLKKIYKIGKLLLGT